MADGKVNTIIIKDRTSGSGGNNGVVRKKDVQNDGKVKPKKRKKKIKEDAVEPSRISRLFNSATNRLTNGMWERGNRLYRASTGAFKGNLVGGVIIGQFIFNEVYNQISNLVKQQEERNNKDILRIRTGDKQIGMNYSVTTNWFTGRIHYKNNR